MNSGISKEDVSEAINYITDLFMSGSKSKCSIKHFIKKVENLKIFTGISRYTLNKKSRMSAGLYVKIPTMKYSFHSGGGGSATTIPSRILEELKAIHVFFEATS